MPTPDLPAEIWLEILSYLPLYSFVKLIGVNRTFFEQALDRNYEEVQLLKRDPRTLRLLEQMR
jgi:F-box-like